MSFLTKFIKCQSSSAVESREILRIFDEILNHVIKIVTTIALLVALQILIQKHSTIATQTIYWSVWIFFCFYLLRLYEYIIIHILENRTTINVASDRSRWVIGISTIIFNLILLYWGDLALSDLVQIGFLQDHLP